MILSEGASYPVFWQISFLVSQSVMEVSIHRLLVALVGDQVQQGAVRVDQRGAAPAPGLALRRVQAGRAGHRLRNASGAADGVEAVEIVEAQAGAEAARRPVEVRIGEEFELDRAALEDKPAGIAVRRGEAERGIEGDRRRLVARRQIGGRPVGHLGLMRMLLASMRRRRRPGKRAAARASSRRLPRAGTPDGVAPPAARC